MFSHIMPYLSAKSKNPLRNERAHFYTGEPRMCALRGRTARTPECPGCLASLRSEQGTAPPCAAMRLSLQTWSAETVLQAVPADQVFIS